MRTYIFIGFLAFVASTHVHKAFATSEGDIYLEEGEGSGEESPEDEEHPSATTHKELQGDQEGSGSSSRPEWHDSGGGAGYDDDEDNYYTYEDYKDEDEDAVAAVSDHYDDHEGSGHGGLNYFEEDDVTHEDDLYLSRSNPKESTPHETIVGIARPVPAPVPDQPVEPDRMPSSTIPPTLTEMENSIRIVTQKGDERQVSIFAQPGILAAFIGGAVMGLLCAILLVMFIVYRMRKRDEGSYPLDEPKRVPLTSTYSPNDKEIYA